MGLILFFGGRKRCTDKNEVLFNVGFPVAGEKSHNVLIYLQQEKQEIIYHTLLDTRLDR